MRRPDGAPPYVYRGDWRETEAHYSAVIAASPLSCMLYNNPIAYGTDVIPDQMGVLAAKHAESASVKESSGDVRRVTGIRGTRATGSRSSPASTI